MSGPNQTRQHLRNTLFHVEKMVDISKLQATKKFLNVIKRLPLYLTEEDLEGSAGGARAPPFFAITCFICNHFEELQTVIIEVKLIINNQPLTYVYPNTIKTYLTLNYLLFGRLLLCYSDITSTVVRNLTVLSRTTDKINSISNLFWHRWKHEYVVNVVKLCETQRASKLNINSKKLCCTSL